MSKKLPTLSIELKKCEKVSTTNTYTDPTPKQEENKYGAFENYLTYANDSQMHYGAGKRNGKSTITEYLFA